MIPVLPLLGVVCCAGSVALAGGLLARRRPTVPLSRLDPAAVAAPGRLSGVAADTVALADRALQRTGRSGQLETALDRAGLRARPADVLVVTGAVALTVGALGLAVGGVPAALLLAALVPLVAVAFVGRRRRARQGRFAEQLGDTLQLMSSSLRAGHSILRTLDTVSRDVTSPTAEEFARVVNETRVGRDLNAALEEVAARTASEDFDWVVQAIAIHREVGGNLAEVLDRVGETIREREELRREASALSAEGRVSGIVLFAMPLVVTVLMLVAVPGYLAPLFSSGTGLVLLLVAAGLMAVGALWMRAVVKVRF